MTTNTTKEATVRQNNDVKQSQGNMSNANVASRETTPAADIYETKEGVVLYLDLPGVNKESLDIDVDSDVLSITGSVNLAIPDNLNPTYMDVNAGVYRRQFTLSAELDSSKIEANLKDGVLMLEIPRSEKHKPRKIEVKVA